MVGFYSVKKKQRQQIIQLDYSARSSDAQRSVKRS
nr:MAG TPA: hypothetical protein [Caudoviricetes sp.]